MRYAMLLLSILLASNAGLADDVAEVRCAEVRFSQAIERGDLDAFRASIDPDARFVAASVRRGVDDIVDEWSVFVTEGGPRVQWRPQIVEVLEDGTLALSRGPYRLTATGPDGEPLVAWGTFNSIWRRDAEGRWRVVFDAGSQSATPPSKEAQALFGEDDPAAACKK